MTDISKRYNVNQPNGKPVGNVKPDGQSSGKSAEHESAQPQAAASAHPTPQLSGDEVMRMLGQLSGPQQATLQQQAVANGSIQDFHTRLTKIMDVINNEIPGEHLSAKAKEVLALQVFNKLYLGNP